MTRTIKEGSYAPMLQGVSQQVHHERLPGQVSEQVNMLSDPQTGLRRRPGAAMVFTGTHAGNALTHLAATEATVGGQNLHVHVDAASGDVKLYNTTGTLLVLLNSTYLVAESRSSIRFSNLNDELFILNTDKAPVLNYSTVDTGNAAKGYFYVEAGAFNKKYRVEVKVDTVTFVAEHTTPDGTGATDAAACTPAAIAAALGAALTVSGLATLAVHYVMGPYIFIKGLSTASVVTVSADESLVYLVPSNQSHIRQASYLPARLPVEADGYTVAVGDARYPTYYTYDADTNTWRESSKSQDITGISNMPISVIWNGSAYAIDASVYEGRTAGDDNTNPQHTFMVQGRITGMSAYQGRLVLLSGNMVSMSAANYPRRFFRTTVTSLLDGDPIEAGSGNITSANFAYAVAFNKDLVLFADRVQAVVPSQNTAITPRTAAVVLTGSYNTDLTAHPVATGRTVLFPVPRSAGKFGLLEMIPSSSTDSQYTSLDVTSHLPAYFNGRCRFAAASAVSRLCVFAPSGNTKELVVHEFLWDNESKAQSAWHRWVFEYDIASAYFYGSELIVCFTKGTALAACRINPRATTYAEGFLDLAWDVQVGNIGLGDNVGQLPAELHQFTVDSVLRGVEVGPEVAYECSIARQGVLITVPPEVANSVRVGVGFTSYVVPTEPVQRDYKERPILTGKASLLNVTVHAANSGPYVASLEYFDGTPEDDQEQGTLLWEQTALGPGVAPVSKYASTVIPVRADSRTTGVKLWTDSLYEFNVQQLDYMLSSMRKTTRR